ncbi:DHA2 family efflux MFS transporter permease subunit [Gordonia sp. PDNC005]|uniref:DHA2 family efflux MFS transporter permease subunit n=1 Tax=unclassified Gordonia (in: high G+C Gram-positive bacteria) TaxID=2657482 RepID=UPI00196483CF|nr:DHA2 family efflux MFS transporter permease subunit [Gordonia sp. PDNC005]QRY63571.1 DHA2 family efflux MFS transporter permease subunit [Gordonia sp. PDNC005]
MSVPGGSTFKPVTDRPWAALMALCIGFFMILVDMSIVAVAQPQIKDALDASVSGIVWVTSAYLLTYAVPLLIAGRLGDKIGPKKVYQAGLLVFTLASLWCGLADSIGELIIARGVQGLGAALITPQTMALITRIFPPERRGAAMGVWGTVAGVATLVGPLLGGILTDSFGWEWIFFVNLPVGLIGLVLAQMLVPDVETHDHKFDWIGVILSAAGLTAIVFGIQEGESYDWAAWIWGLIGGGIAFMVLFVVWESKMRAEPLVPLSLFRNRNFTLSNIGIMSMGFAVSGSMIPIMFFLQLVGGMSPTRSALIMVPMAVLTGILAPIVGRILDRVHPSLIVATGLLGYAIATAWAGFVFHPDTPVWLLLLPTMLMGVSSAGIWAPLAATATRDLPWHQAGAGAGVYNTTRVVGSVIGASAIGALMMSRLAANVPGADFDHSEGGATGQLPEMIRGGFADAMGQSIYLAAGMLLIGFVATLFLKRPAHQGAPAPAKDSLSA